MSEKTLGFPKLEQDVQDISKFQPPPLSTPLPPRAKQINGLKVRDQRQWQSCGQQQAKLTCEQKPRNTHTNQKIQQRRWPMKRQRMEHQQPDYPSIGEPTSCLPEITFTHPSAGCHLKEENRKRLWKVEHLLSIGHLKPKIDWISYLWLANLKPSTSSHTPKARWGSWRF